jgi:hypothetical protein
LRIAATAVDVLGFSQRRRRFAGRVPRPSRPRRPARSIVRDWRAAIHDHSLEGASDRAPMWRYPHLTGGRARQVGDPS